MRSEESRNKKYNIKAENKSEARRLRFGIGWWIVYIIFGLSAVVYLIAVFNEPFADFISMKVGHVVRYALAIPTSILPFSLAEVLLILMIPGMIVLTVLAVKRYCDSWHNVLVFSGKLITVVPVILIIFVWSLGTGYHGSTLDKKLGIEKQEVSELELYELTEKLTFTVNELSDRIGYIKDTSFSDMPYGRRKLNDKLLTAYDKVSDSYECIPRMKSRVKPVMMSELMSYSHITGVYTFFTGEANINIAFPDYTIPFTAAHEMAHQRGISREDEANFVAFLVCAASEDDYIKYSGYLNLLEYVTSAYAKAVNANKCLDYKSFRELASEYDEAKIALAEYESDNGELKDYKSLTDAMAENEKLYGVINGNEKLAEALGYYNNRLTSVNRYNSVRAMLNENIRAEQLAYNEFFEKYEKNIVATVSGAVNNTYLQIQGTAGTASYGMVVDVAVAYFKSLPETH